MQLPHLHMFSLNPTLSRENRSHPLHARMNKLSCNGTGNTVYIPYRMCAIRVWYRPRINRFTAAADVTQESLHEQSFTQLLRRDKTPKGDGNEEEHCNRFMHVQAKNNSKSFL